MCVSQRQGETELKTRAWRKGNEGKVEGYKKAKAIVGRIWGLLTVPTLSKTFPHLASLSSSLNLAANRGNLICILDLIYSISP